MFTQKSTLASLRRTIVAQTYRGDQVEDLAMIDRGSMGPKHRAQCHRSF